MSLLDSNKSVGPKSISTKVLKLLKNDISSQLSEIFNISFSSGVFPSMLKIADVIPVHEKDSKLDFQIIAQFYFYVILKNIKSYKIFSDNSIIYSLQFGFRQKYSKAHAPLALLKVLRKT